MDYFKTAMQLDRQDLENITRGACLLGSGGGGGYKLGMRLAKGFENKSFYKDASGQPVNYVQVATVEEIKAAMREAPRISPQPYGVVVAYIGSPSGAKELCFPKAAVAAAMKMDEIIRAEGKEIACIFPGEVGAGSTLIACLTAAKLGVPVVDADGAGRALPTLDLATYAAAGVPVNPTILSNELFGAPENFDYRQHEQVELRISDSSNASKIESLARPVILFPEFNQMAGFAIWLINLAELKDEMVISGTLSLCKALGEKIEEEQGKEHRSMNEVLDVYRESTGLHAQCLCEGQLVSVSGSAVGGFDVGIIEVEEKKTKRRLKIIVKNEMLILWDNSSGEPIAMAPDLITLAISPKAGSEELRRQWVFANDDIMENGELIPELRDADVTIVGLQASSRLMASEKRLASICLQLQNSYPDLSSASKPTSDYFPQHYMRILNALGYYGKYLPLKR